MINVFLLGDSISLDYRKYINDFLEEEIVLFGKPGTEAAYKNLDTPIAANGGDSEMVLEYIRGEGFDILKNCKYLFFNCGLHDIKHETKTGEIQIPLEEYESNLRRIVEFIQDREIYPVFINTTPAATERYDETYPFYRLTEDVPKYNEVAEKVMHERCVPVIDLYSFTKALKLEGDELFRDHTHFNNEVIKMHAAFIAGEINGFTKR